MRKPNHLEGKETAVLFICFSLIFIFYLILVFQIPADKIYGDEIFFYDQAKTIAEKGEFVNFQNTQPLLYPIILSLFYKNLIFSRILNVLLIIFSSILVFVYLKKNFDFKTALFGMMVFVLNPLTILLGVSLYTESVFTFLLLSSFLIFDKIKKSNSWISWVFFGIILGLLSQARITGLLVAFFFFAYLSLKQNLKLQHLFCAIITISIVIPYFALGGLSFLFEKQIGVHFDFVKPFVAIGKFLWPMAFFFLLGIYFCSKTEKEKSKKEQILLHLFFLIVIFILLSSLTGIVFERHWFILFPSFVIVASAGFYDLFKFKKKFRLFFFIIFFISIIFYFLLILNLKLPHNYYSQFFYLEIPEKCIEIKKVNITNNFQFDEEKNILVRDKGKTIELPYLSQPQGQFLYFFDFFPQDNYSYLILEYADDVGIVIINDLVVGHITDTYAPDVFEYNFTKNKSTEINILIENVINIGGIGQILICKKKI